MKRGAPVRIKKRAGRPKIFYIRWAKHPWFMIYDIWYREDQLEFL